MCEAQVALVHLGGHEINDAATRQRGMVAVMVAVQQMAASCCGGDMTAGWSGLLWQLAASCCGW